MTDDTLMIKIPPILTALRLVPSRIRNSYRMKKKLKAVSFCDSSKLLHSSSIDNQQNNRLSISLGENAIVAGQLLVFKHAGRISIGKDCYIGEGSRIWSAVSITIKDRVLISHGVNIHDNNSHSLSAQNRHQHFIDIFSTGHPEELEDVSSKPVLIEDDVWIGFNATILKGVTIGRGAVVGACSVVTKDVPPFSVVVGNPAKVVGKSSE